MTGWLLDTDVLSALAPRKPPLDARTAAWLEEHSNFLYLSTITAAEIEAGIAKLARTGASRRAEGLRVWFNSILDSYAEHILPFDLPAAQIAGALGDASAAAGRHPGFADIAIAAIAKSQDLVVLTRNLRHFSPLGVATLDPFDAS